MSGAMRDRQRELIGAVEAFRSLRNSTTRAIAFYAANQPQNETSNTTPCISKFTKYKMSYFKMRKCAEKIAKSFIGKNREQTGEGEGEGTADRGEPITGDRPEPLAIAEPAGRTGIPALGGGSIVWLAARADSRARQSFDSRTSMRGSRKSSVPPIILHEFSATAMG
jgi:hypothetical protein